MNKFTMTHNIPRGLAQILKMVKFKPRIFMARSAICPSRMCRETHLNFRARNLKRFVLKIVKYSKKLKSCFEFAFGPASFGRSMNVSR